MKFLLPLILISLYIHDSSERVLWPCKSDLDCEVPNSFCSTQKYCECPAGYTFSTDVTKCLKEQPYGLACEESTQCSHMLTGSQCENGVCGCASDYTYARGRCRKLNSLNETCRENIDCFFGYNRESVTCKEGVCQCAEDFYQRYNNICRRKSTIGDYCLVHADCNLQPNLACINKKCTSSVNSRNDSVSTDKNNQETRKDASVQTQSFESISDSAFYLDKSSSFSNNNRDSIHYNKLNSVTSDGEATKFSSVESSVKDESTQFGDSCSEEHKPCQFEYSVCRRGLCHCQDGFFESEKKCKAELGEHVSDKKFCGAGIYKRDRCVCDNHQFYHPSLRSCAKSALGIGGSCTIPAQCSPYGAAFCSTVTPKVCKCHEYAVYNKATELCELKSGLGQYCQSDQDCKPLPNTMCTHSNTCQCKPSYTAQNDECKPGIGAPCETADDCVFENAECEKAEVTIENEKHKDNDKESEKYCKCKKNYVQVEDNCLEEAQNYNDTCIDSEQCKPLLGDKSSCIDNKCQCDDSLHYKDGTCNEKKALGETCDRSGDCFVNGDPERVECRNSVCQCQFHYKTDGETQKCVKSGENSSSHPSPLKIITLLLIASATLITGSAIKDAYYP